MYDDRYCKKPMKSRKVKKFANGGLVDKSDMTTASQLNRETKSNNLAPKKDGSRYGGADLPVGASGSNERDHYLFRKAVSHPSDERITERRKGQKDRD